MMRLSPLRTLLFVPGNRPDRFEKAIGSGTDAVIMDLEDAVLPGQKGEARVQVRAGLLKPSPVPLIVRVNGLDTPHFGDDVRSVVGEGLSGVMVPKVESADQLSDIHAAITEAENAQGLETGALPLIAMIETAQGVDRISEIVRVRINPSRLHTIAFGAADYTLDLGIEMTRLGTELLYARSRLAVACRAAGLERPIDTPFMLDLKDQEALTEDAMRARQLGFQGKLCIHPNQIEVCNRVFSPTEAEVRYAEKVIQAFEAAGQGGQGVLQMDGKFIDLPIVARARKVARMANLLEARRRADD